MYKSIIFTVLFLTFSVPALAEESDIQIFDNDYERQMIIKQEDGQFDVFDRSYNRRGHIRDNDIYDNRYDRKGSIYKGGDRRSNRDYR